jgi:uncharacterized protein YndB with AHSA1/START domain
VSLSEHSLSLIVRRVIAATPEQLFLAWTSPAQLTAWWGPKGVRCIGAEVDLRVGGSYRIGNQLPDGSVIWIRGEFESVTPPHELIYSWSLSPGTNEPERVRVSFIRKGASTEVIVVHERIANPSARTQHELGWQGCLGGLETHLASG